MDQTTEDQNFEILSAGFTIARPVAQHTGGAGQGIIYIRRQKHEQGLVHYRCWARDGRRYC